MSEQSSDDAPQSKHPLDLENCDNILPSNKKMHLEDVLTENYDGVKHSEIQAPELFNGVETTKLTKRQMKKYQKMLKWEASKKEKRAKERAKAKKRKIEAKLNNIDLGPSRRELKRSTMRNSSCKIGVVIDLSFDDLMISKVSFIIYTENSMYQFVSGYGESY